jgi:hypothetical protein
MVELALTFPLLMMVVFGIIVLGIGAFYQQQISNIGREAARYAITHTATSQCPTVSNLAPDAALLPAPNSYYECDKPSNRWPQMTAFAREKAVGLPSAGVRITACWSGYWTKDTSGNWAAHDQPPKDQATGAANLFRNCTLPIYGWCDGASGGSSLHTIDSKTGIDAGCGGSDSVSIDCSREFPLTSASNDMASSWARSNSTNANTVTVLTCYNWQPPLAGFLLIPQNITLRATVTESLEYQQ